jgi:hypothetical protein
MTPYWIEAVLGTSSWRRSGRSQVLEIAGIEAVLAARPSWAESGRHKPEQNQVLTRSPSPS